MNKRGYQALHRIRSTISTMLALLVALTVATGSALAQTGTLANEMQTRLEGIVTDFMANSGAPGISVAVVQDGEFVWSAGFGMADLENSVSATPQTLYRLGSISKPLTAVAAMALAEQGMLDLDAPVQTYCPQFPQKPWPLTTRQLLGHLGGIRTYNVPEQPYSKSQSDPEVGNTLHFADGIDGGLQFFADEPLVAQPGTHFNYSTQGYTVVGCAIEGASGQTFEEAMRKYVLVPAGMQQTRPDDRFAVIPLRTRFYSKDSTGAVVNAEFLDSSYKVPGGGLLSSADDMARFAVAILDDQLIKRETRDVMWTPQIPTDGLGRMVYGLGWQVGNIRDVADVGHGGSQQGTSTTMLIAPEARAGVVVLINSDAVGSSQLAPQLLSVVLGLPLEQQEIMVDPQLYDAYVGNYQMNDFRLAVTREDNSLALALGEQKFPLFAESVSKFFIKVVDAQITFITSASGLASGLIVHQGGFDTYLSRVE